MVLIGVGVLFVVSLLLLVALLVLLERKVLGLAQLRKGPNIVGIYGILQTVVDGVKLLTKEMVLVTNDRFVFFYVSPFLLFSLATMGWFFMPGMGGGEGGGMTILVILYISSMGVYGVLWAGWGSGSVYSLMGGVRAVAQMISYEIVMALFILLLVYFSGSLDWEGLGEYYGVGGVGATLWLVVVVIWGGIVLAELNRVPFDLVEGESELVGGYNVEYSGYGFTLFFLAEYMNIWLLCWLSLVLFGGWNSLWMLVVAVVGVVYVRGLLPRYKFTDLIGLTWRIYLPIVLFGCMMMLLADAMCWGEV
uniref:NADH-ubiquinone oxidoreductase chain 1 n=1 Tax=Phallusia fumigata TaxID=395376 RepID=A7WL95_9ASCI|nr:NADH dehydrogenase subunit 1 [Phallusia fumigata]CAL24363.1 NADH dehydrogenase subunit 1 [Phallusia fumigata]